MFPLSPIQLFVQSLSRVHDPRFSIIETTVAAVDGKAAKQMKEKNGEPIYAQRPLLEAIQEYHRDYLVQVKENQSKVLEQMKLIFADAAQRKPDDRKVSKKRGAWTVLTSMALSVANLMRSGERTLRELRERIRENPLNAVKCRET